MRSRIRSSRIRSGNFGALGLNKTKTECAMGLSSNFQSGSIRVNREYIPTTYDTDVPVSIDFQLQYSIYNFNRLPSHENGNPTNPGNKNSPLICIHGGPGIPSDYLKPLANSTAFQDRALILYDQIGCGRSSEPSDINAYSIADAVRDLTSLIHHLRVKYGLREFHLFGHSYGGILAYEYFKRCTALTEKDSDSNLPLTGVLSITLSSSPFNIRQVDEDSEREIKILSLASMTDQDVHNATLHEVEAEARSRANESFQRSFVCRTPCLPLPLQEAYAKRGKVWGADSNEIQAYVASQGLQEKNPSSLSTNDNSNSDRNLRNPKLPSFLLMRGEFDFVSPTQSVKNWKEMLEFKHGYNGSNLQIASIIGAGHYGMLDSSSLYHAALDNFLSRSEENEAGEMLRLQ